MADYRGLGFDPAPGNAGAVAAAAARCAFDVPVPGVPVGWEGAAAEGFRTRLEAVVSELTAVRRAMRAAAEVLDAWAGTLLGNQRRAEDLDRRATALRRELAEAADEVDRCAALASFTPAHGEAHAAVTARHDGIARRLDEVLEEARLLARDHHAEARRVAERLRSEEPSTALADTLADFSALTAELASVLLGPAGPAAGRGAAEAFAAGLG
ncbi:hypothetical protein ABZ816_22640 [Actinosynnema sp. NPDC047251]|uniref:Uncharacterized protein n=1 Tax=Saccharothrix espanaensis (strain ATCC 51144 / DSM 44229 / JCM 9112 / NBRC 15066 / NRRL 15764) TaxID=1179773 RepID=K0K5R3_SACES|nr:hypothetical protein [Saccharothrix espanaensis]CCH33601.1 hypothetical protein BN6_63570 [Saccharothrix espanaensis DSM 44229]